MVLLDTDHLTVLRHVGSRAVRLQERLAASSRAVGTTVVNVEEAMRGWLAAIAKEREIERQSLAYRELAALFHFFSGFEIALLDLDSAATFRRLRASGVRIGSMDLKIASIALALDALLLTSNLRDFQAVPGIRMENWLSG